MKAQNTNVKVLIANAVSDPGESELAPFKATGSTGEVLVVERDGSAIAAASTGIIIATKKADGTLDQSEIIPTAGIVRARAKSYTAGTNQVDYIGHNPVTNAGSIDADNSTHYLLNVRINEYGSKSIDNYEILSGEYFTDASATQAEIADGVACSFAASQADWDQERFTIECIAPITSDDALGTGVDALQFTNGSKFFTATDIDDATTNAALAVGDFIRVGTADTDPIYKITAIDTTNNIGTLSYPFQGATTSGLVDTGAKRIPAADAATLDFGIKLAAKDLTAVPGKFDVEKIRFRTDLENFGSTTLTREATAAFVGLGSGAQVREHEWFARGNFGEMYRTGQPSLFDNDLIGVAATNYDVLTIDYYLDERERLTYVSSPRTLVVYCNEASSSAAINALIGDLNNNTVSAELAALTTL